MFRDDSPSLSQLHHSSHCNSPIHAQFKEALNIAALRSINKNIQDHSHSLYSSPSTDRDGPDWEASERFVTQAYHRALTADHPKNLKVDESNSVPPTEPENMAPSYEIRTGGEGKNKKQSMADLKLRRLNELNSRLKEDLERPRVKVSEASAS